MTLLPSIGDGWAGAAVPLDYGLHVGWPRRLFGVSSERSAHIDMMYASLHGTSRAHPRSGAPFGEFAKRDLFRPLFGHWGELKFGRTVSSSLGEPRLSSK